MTKHWLIGAVMAISAFGAGPFFSASVLAQDSGTQVMNNGILPTHSIWDGVYSLAQAARGQTEYAHDCERCHGLVLEGDGESVPPMVGDHFMSNWDKQSVADLIRRIQLTQPFDDPGDLDKGEAIDLVAFILAENGVPAGKSDIPTDHPGQAAIGFDYAPPAKK